MSRGYGWRLQVRLVRASKVYKCTLTHRQFHLKKTLSLWGWSNSLLREVVESVLDNIRNQAGPEKFAVSKGELD